jgi:uncharacterized membrane protein
MDAQSFFLAIAYWLHMLATVVWLGGLSTLALLVIPAARRALDPAAYAALLAKIQPRLQSTGWLSLAVLAATGMFQMSASPHYNGFLSIDSPWAAAILVKHLLIGLMIAASAYSTWGLLPALRRLALLRAAGRSVADNQQATLERRERLLLSLNLLLSVAVLALTALARASY